jgi:chitinase
MKTRVVRGLVVGVLVAGTALSTPRPSAAHERPSKRVGGYFTNWGIYGRNYLVNDIKKSGSADKLTHIFYAFANVTADLKCGVSDSWSDFGKRFEASQSVDGVADAWWPPQLAGNFNQLQKLKLEHPDLKLMISVGGWSFSDKFSDAALTPASRQAFVASCVDMYVRGNFGSEIGPVPGLFDGIDIDWEFPGVAGATNNFRPEDTKNFTALMAELRAQLDAEGVVTGKHYELSAATSPYEATASKIELAKVAKSLDFFNLMAYDFHGKWETQTNFLAPLLPSPRDPYGPKLNVSYAVAYYVTHGVPAKKLVIGEPAYGIGWSGVPATRSGLYQAATGLPAGVWEPGVNDYKVLAPLAATASSGYKSYRDPLSLGFWIYNPTDKVFWTYDDVATARLKGGLVQALGLGGTYVWELSGDDAQGSLLSALSTSCGN